MAEKMFPYGIKALSFAILQVLEAQMLPTAAPFYVGLAAAVAMFARRYVEYSGMTTGLISLSDAVNVSADWMACSIFCSCLLSVLCVQIFDSGTWISWNKSLHEY